MKAFLLIVFFLSVGTIQAQKIGEHPIRSIKFLKKNPKKMELAELLWKTSPVNEDKIYKKLGLEKENKGNGKKEDSVVEESVTFTFGHCRHHAMKGSDRKPEK